MNHSMSANFVASIASLAFSVAAGTAGPLFDGTTAKQAHHHATAEIESIRVTTGAAFLAEAEAPKIHTGTEVQARDVVDSGPDRPVDRISATAPGCIYLQQWSVWEDNKYWKYAQMTNYCSYSYSVRMIWSWAFDGSCVNLHPRATWTEKRGRQAHVSELRMC